MADTSLNNDFFSRLNKNLEESDKNKKQQEKIILKMNLLLFESLFMNYIETAKELAQIKNIFFSRYPEFEVKKRDEVEKTLVHEKNYLAALVEDGPSFKSLLNNLNDLIVSLNETNNYTIFEQAYEPLFDISRNIERKLVIFRQLSSKRKLEKMFR